LLWRRRIRKIHVLGNDALIELAEETKCRPNCFTASDAFDGHGREISHELVAAEGAAEAGAIDALLIAEPELKPER